MNKFLGFITLIFFSNALFGESIDFGYLPKDQVNQIIADAEAKYPKDFVAISSCVKRDIEALKLYREIKIKQYDLNYEK